MFCYGILKWNKAAFLNSTPLDLAYAQHGYMVANGLDKTQSESITRQDYEALKERFPD